MKNSDKYVAARLWKSNLKIVSVEWLLACLKTWSRVDEESYLLKEKKEANEDEISTADEEGSESEMSAALNGVGMMPEGQVTPASPVVVPVQEPSSPVPVPFVPSIPSAPVQEPPSSVLQLVPRTSKPHTEHLERHSFDRQRREADQERYQRNHQ